MIRSWRDYNYFLIGCVIVLTGFSIAMIYSVTLKDPFTQGYFSRHLVNLLVGIIAMALLTVLDYHALQSWARPLYLLMIGLLGVVELLGNIQSGAQSWLDLGLRTFQPSEPAKLLIIIALAAYWSHFESSSSSWKVQLGGLILAGIPMMLIFIQPDFGTTMVFAFVWFMMAWIAGIRGWQLLVLLVIAIPIGVYGWTHILDPYQRTRLLVFIDPLKYDPELKEGAWNIMQSLTAIGSGGLTGHGWTHGLLSQGRYLPVQYSDFIFASTSEELGFIGSTVLLLFEGLMIWQALAIASVARDSFGRLLTIGIAAMFLCHILINVGMNMSIMPVTGIPLPFMSYGGSFTMTSLAAIGMIESVALGQRKIVF